MSSQTSTSLRQSLDKTKVRELHKAGKWPPEGHPLRPLALLDPKGVEDFFRGEIWAALVEGLQAYHDNAVSLLLRQEDAEARGVANITSDIIRWEAEIKAFYEAIKE